MILQEATAFLGTAWDRTRETLKTALRSDVSLLDAVNMSLLSNSGKLLRPILSLLSASACRPGETLPPDAIRFAAVSELLHNASLIHDDVVDGAGKRRGRPTIHSVLGSPAAVLIGDFWLVKGVNLVLGSDCEEGPVLRLFAKTVADLAEGEMLQLEKSGTADTTEQDYERIIYNKTASLFRSAMVSGAIAVDAPEPFRKAVETYAVSLGMAFQVRDDLMDYGDAEDIGKPMGTDLREQKITLPLLGALSTLPPEEAEEVRGKVRSILEHPEYVTSIRALVLEKDGLGYARKRMKEWIARAVGALSVLPDSPGKDFLSRIAVFVGERKK